MQKWRSIAIADLWSLMSIASVEYRSDGVVYAFMKATIWCMLMKAKAKVIERQGRRIGRYLLTSHRRSRSTL
jgi:hypothetical protein